MILIQIWVVVGDLGSVSLEVLFEDEKPEGGFQPLVLYAFVFLFSSITHLFRGQSADVGESFSIRWFLLFSSKCTVVMFDVELLVRGSLLEVATMLEVEQLERG